MKKSIVGLGACALAAVALSGLAASTAPATAAVSAPVPATGLSVKHEQPPSAAKGVDLMVKNETSTTFDVYYATDGPCQNWKFGARLSPGQTFTHGDCHSTPSYPDVAYKIVVDGRLKLIVKGSNPTFQTPYVRIEGRSEYNNGNDLAYQIDNGLWVGEWANADDVNEQNPKEYTTIATCHRDSDNKDGWKQLQCYVKHIPSKNFD